MEKIPEHIKRFIAEYIGSLQQLEVLLVLWKEQNRQLNAKQIGERTGMSSMTVANRVMNLWAKGLITAKESDELLYQYRAKNEQIEAAIKDLAPVYDMRKDDILEIIMSRSDLTLRNFSDAFKLRKKDKNDG